MKPSGYVWRSRAQVVGLALAGLLLLATWPQLLSLHRFPILAQLTAMRGLLAVTGTLGALLFGIVSWRSSRLRRFGLAMAGTLVVMAALNVALLVSRGLSTHEVQSEHIGDVTVFIWNMYRDGPDPELVASFAIEHAVDVISLLETSPAAAQVISTRLEEAGRPMQVFVNTIDEVSKARSTVLLVSSDMGQYAIDDSVGSTPRVPAVVARPLEGGGPSLIAAHAAPPLPFMMGAWNGGLNWLAERCLETNVIVAGDFNATLDHFVGLREPDSDVGACRDAAMAMGSASIGTWPSQLPVLLSSPIDHVVATHEWEFIEFRVVLELDGQGSDHRALLAKLQQNPGPP